MVCLLFDPHSARLSPTSICLVLRLAAAKLPTQMEFINRSSLPRLGNLLIPPPPPAAKEVDLSAIPAASAEAAAPSA